MACGIAHHQLRQFNEETGTVNSRIVCPHLQLVHPFIVHAVDPGRIVRQKDPVHFGRSFSFVTSLAARESQSRDGEKTPIYKQRREAVGKQQAPARGDSTQLQGDSALHRRRCIARGFHTPRPAFFNSEAREPI